jgi:hypothetical protein
MFVQSVLGVKHGELLHGTVAGDLGDDGGGGDGRATGIAVDDGQFMAIEAGLHVAVDEAKMRLEAETLDGPAHGEKAGAENIMDFDFLGGGDADGPMNLGMIDEELVEVLPVFTQEHFRIVQVAMLEAIGKNGGGGEDGTGPAPAANLINTGNNGHALRAQAAFEFPAERIAAFASDHGRMLTQEIEGGSDFFRANEKNQRRLTCPSTRNEAVEASGLTAKTWVASTKVGATFSPRSLSHGPWI